MIILIASLHHFSAGTYGSRRRSPFIPVPASAATTSRSGSGQARQVGSGGPFAIIGSVPPSAIREKSFLAEAAARQNPHRRQTTRRFPQVRSSEAFGRRPLHRPINRLRPASETLHVRRPLHRPINRLRPASETLHVSGPLMKVGNFDTHRTSD